LKRFLDYQIADDSFSTPRQNRARAAIAPTQFDVCINFAISTVDLHQYCRRCAKSRFMNLQPPQLMRLDMRIM